MQFVIQVQDIAKKYRYKKLMLGVPKAINQKLNFQVSLPGVPDNKTLLGLENYKKWIENFKIAQRPYWTGDDSARTCFICEIEFGFFERQHHCRKCGTVVCSQCSKYFVKMPELAYYQRVRMCRNCLEELYKARKE